jgi:predicted dehydrogenase
VLFCDGRASTPGDIGTHWLDTVTFILGRRVDRVFAQLVTHHKKRRRPVGEVKTFERAQAPRRSRSYSVRTEDFASVLLRFRGGAHGNVAVSQVAAGRKNSIRIEVYGTMRSAFWESEEPNTIHYGSREGPNAVAHRGCPGFSEDTAGLSDYPPGHAEGFPDTFKMLYRTVYADIARAAAGAAVDSRPRPLYATVEDGHREVQLCEAILQSHRAQTWVSIPS